MSDIMMTWYQFARKGLHSGSSCFELEKSQDSKKVADCSFNLVVLLIGVLIKNINAILLDALIRINLYDLASCTNAPDWQRV